MAERRAPRRGSGPGCDPRHPAPTRSSCAAATDGLVEGDGPSSTVVPGSDHTLFMGRIGAARTEVALVAVGITAGGAEVRVPF